MIANSTLKEYEIIALIYNKKYAHEIFFTQNEKY